MTEQQKVPPVPRPATTVLLVRPSVPGEPNSILEVFMVVRHQAIDSFSGALVFPGGKLEDADGDSRLRERCGASADSIRRVLRRVGRVGPFDQRPDLGGEPVERPEAVVRLQQRLGLATKLRVARARRVQEGGPARGLVLERLAHHFLDAPPATRRPAGCHSVSSRFR